ncbi:MAG TPA: CPBP family intramembrane metalloprotease [Tissierellia bacterium]|nr:CPBP family intramembrane metalloprotease [Tissierellia bacterium]
MHFRKIQWFVLITMIIHLAGSVFQGFFVEDYFVQIYLGQLIFLVLGLWFLVRHRKKVVEYARLQLPPWWSFLIVIPVVFSTMMLSSFVTALSMLLTRAIGLVDMPPQDFSLTTSSNLLLVLTFSVLPGIVEEFYCRGVLLRGYEESVSTKQAIVYSSIMFGLMHFNLWNVLSPIVLGIVFSLLAIRFQSIIPSIFGHALFNLLVLGVQKMELSEEMLAAQTDISWSGLIEMLPTTAVAGLFLGWLFWRLGVSKLFEPAKVKLRLRDHLPTALIGLLFVGISYLIQKGLGL